MNNNNDDYKRDIRVDSTPPSDMRPPYPMPMPPSRRPSRFWIFVLSFMPGLSHMYLGLIRRGLFYMSLLALIIFFTITLLSHSGLFGVFTGLSIAALYAVSFFEAFSIRRDIVMGKEVKDAIPNFGMPGSNKVILIIIAIVVAAVLGVNILSSLPWYAWMILGIVAICYAPFIRKKKHDKAPNDENNK